MTVALAACGSAAGGGKASPAAAKAGGTNLTMWLVTTGPSRPRVPGQVTPATQESMASAETHGLGGRARTPTMERAIATACASRTALGGAAGPR